MQPHKLLNKFCTLARPSNGPSCSVGVAQYVAQCSIVCVTGVKRTVCPHLQAITDTGSMLNLSWTSDGTQLAGAGANGNICFAQLVGLTAEVGPICATLTDSNCVKVYHLLDETTDELDFRDRVVKMCLGGDRIFVIMRTFLACSVHVCEVIHMHEGTLPLCL